MAGVYLQEHDRGGTPLPQGMTWEILLWEGPLAPISRRDAAPTRRPLLQNQRAKLYGAAYRAITNPCERGQAVSHGCVPEAMIQEDVLKLPFFAM